MSTYSPSLRIELITTGDQAGTWGTTTNSNLGTLIESAIAGYTSVSITSANQALTALNGAADQSRNMVIALTTTTTANFNVYAPPAEKTYVIQNTSGYTATIFNSTVIGNTTAAGAGVSIPAGKTMTIWSDGTNFALQNTSVPTASFGTNDTTPASTAFVQAALQALHPVGSVYINASNGTNPATLLGFGTWTSFGAGRVPVGFNAGDSRFDTPEETGGSYDATLPTHTHTWSGSSSGTTGATDLPHTHNFSAGFSGTTGANNEGHTHGFSGSTLFAGDHRHLIPFGSSGVSGTVVVNGEADNNVFEGYKVTEFAGQHTHTFSGNTGLQSNGHAHAFSGSVGGTTGGNNSSMNHNHSVSISTSGSNSTEGSSASGANIQPYITVYMWKRIA